MTRVLELDVFAPQNDVIKYKGESHEVLPVRVQALLNVIQSVQKLQDVQGDEGAAEASAKAMADILGFIKKNVPTLPSDDLSLGEIVALIRFMAESAGEQAGNVSATAPATPQDAEKKTEKPASESPTPSHES